MAKGDTVLHVGTHGGHRDLQHVQRTKATTVVAVMQLTGCGRDSLRAGDGTAMPFCSNSRLSWGKVSPALLVDLGRNLFQAVQRVRVGLLRLNYRLAEGFHLALDFLRNRAKEE